MYVFVTVEIIDVAISVIFRVEVCEDQRKKIMRFNKFNRETLNFFIP